MTQENNNLSSHTADNVLRIDRESAQRQLKYLGYKSPENVYLRLFYHSDDPRKHDDKGRKLNRLQWKEVENYQQDGRGVYVVVNGADGGHEDKEIKQCAAIFCEWDDRPVEEQLLHWETVGFLEPTFTIYSGDKSAQPYWVFEQPVSVEQWRELQLLLIEVMSADPSNKNPSRVFRLAGGWHIKPGREPVRTEIVQNSGKKYSYEAVRQELQCLTQKGSASTEMMAVQKPQMRSHNVDLVPQYQRYEDISIPIPVAVPLYQCLAKQSRTLLQSGVNQPGRNTGGAALARDLIGTANYLQSIGQDFDGDPRQLLSDYASRCTPPLAAKEVEAIWKSAQKDNPEPSCKPVGIEACLRGWYWKNHLKPNQSFYPHSQSGRGFSNGGDRTIQPTASLCDRISVILNRCETESALATALMDLATATGRSYNEINQLAKIIRTEGELATQVIEAAKSFGGILKSCRKRLDIRRYLEPTFTQSLLAKANAMPTAPEYLFNSLLAASGSRIGTASRIIINPEGGYKQPCVFWTTNVNHSGQAKTPPQQAVVEPLEEMEAAASHIHDIEVEDYQADKNGDRKPPVRLRRLLNNTTISQKIRIHGENPRGLLEYIDELVSDYQRLNQYTRGKGDDLQLELGFWNGTGCNYDRHDARLFLKRTALSKTGTYQWDTLARLMADEVNFVASGYSARFLYCSITDAPPRYLDLLSEQTQDTFKEKLYWLYTELERLPETDYLLSHEAKVLFQGWNHTLVNAEIEESHFGLSLVYAKIESYTARIALWLHIVNAVLRGEKPAAMIDGKTMQHAIEIASFYLWQHKLIHAHNSPTRSLEGIFLKVQTQAEKFFAKCGKGVGASFLKTRINSLKGWVTEKIRTVVFKTLAAAGHGRIEGEGSEMIYIPNTVSEASGNELVDIGDELVAPPIAPSIINNELQPEIGKIGIFSTSVESSHATHWEVELEAEESSSHHDMFMGEPPAIEFLHQTVASTEDTLARHCPHREMFMGETPKTTLAHQTLRGGGDTSARECLHREMFMGETPKTTLAHQSTNLNGETLTVSEVQAVGDTTNSLPTPQIAPTAQELAATVVQCTTWVQVVEAVERNKQRLLSAAKQMAQDMCQNLSVLLAQHLCSHPEDMEQLTWLPIKLITKALQKLSFTIERIAECSVDDAHWEQISGCSFESVNRLGEKGEIWIYTTPNGERFPAATSEITAIALVANTQA